MLCKWVASFKLQAISSGDTGLMILLWSTQGLIGGLNLRIKYSTNKSNYIYVSSRFSKSGLPLVWLSAVSWFNKRSARSYHAKLWRSTIETTVSLTRKWVTFILVLWVMISWLIEGLSSLLIWLVTLERIWKWFILMKHLLTSGTGRLMYGKIVTNHFYFIKILKGVKA